MTSFTFSMPAGIPGAVNRVGGGATPVIEAVQQHASTPVTAYGFAGFMDATAGTLRMPASGDAAPYYGVLVRPFPLQQQTTTQAFGAVALGAATPPGAGSIVDVIRKGYVTVLLQNSTAAVKGGIVYVRNVTSGANVAGGLEAASGANLVATLWTFMGPADASGNVEIFLN